MLEWSEDFSERTLKEIVGLQEENRAWQRELRIRATALVNSKLAKQIGPEEYASKRQAATKDADECKRRGRILVREVWSRRSSRKPSFAATL